MYLLDTLRGSVVWSALLELVARGGVLAGSSAGAMILGGQMWVPGEGWRAGLAAVPRLAFIPHHATLAARWGAEKMRGILSPGVTLVGLDECAGLAGSDRSWRAIGAGEVTVYADAGTKVCRAGQEVQFD